MDRREFIGGSDVAAIVGLSPWKTAYRLWEEKTGRDEQDDSENGEAKQWGKRLEAPVMEMVQDEWNIAVGQRNVVYTMPGKDWARAEVDFDWTDDAGNLCNGDVKTSHWRKAHEWGEPWSDEVPPYYACQFLWGQMVTGRRTTLCATLLGVGELRPYLVNWDENTATWIYEQAERFWEANVLRDEPPPITTSEDASRALARFRGVSICASGQTLDALKRIRGIHAAKKRLDAAEARYKLAAQMQMALAVPDGSEEPAKFGVVDETGKLLASWNEQHRKGFTVQPSTFRVFRIHQGA